MDYFTLDHSVAAFQHSDETDASWESAFSATLNENAEHFSGEISASSGGENLELENSALTAIFSVATFHDQLGAAIKGLEISQALADEELAFDFELAGSTPIQTYAQIPSDLYPVSMPEYSDAPVYPSPPMDNPASLIPHQHYGGPVSAPTLQVDTSNFHGISSIDPNMWSATYHDAYTAPPFSHTAQWTSDFPSNQIGYEDHFHSYLTSPISKSHIKSALLSRPSILMTGQEYIGNVTSEDYGSPMSAVECDDGVRHPCSHCNKVFRRRNDLRRHLISHQYDRPSYPCELCGKVFTRSDTRLRHVKGRKCQKGPAETEICVM